MEMRQIEAFLVVADELHFGRAAARLHIAQSPLSQLIKALERDLGTALFIRTTRSVRLTEAGAALLEPAHNIAAQAAVARSVAVAAATGEIGTVSIGFGGTSGYSVISDLIRIVSDRFPGVHLRLVPQSYTGEVAAMLARGTLDMGIIGLPAPRGLAARPVREESLLVAIPAMHRLATRTAINIADLADERFVVFPAEHGSRVRDMSMALCTSAGFVPSIAQEAPDPYSMLSLVGVGVGVAIVVAATSQMSLDGVVYRPLADNTPTLRIGFGWNPGNVSTATARVIGILDELVT